jgi:hypothetical protein
MPNYKKLYHKAYNAMTDADRLVQYQGLRRGNHPKRNRICVAQNRHGGYESAVPHIVVVC